MELLVSLLSDPKLWSVLSLPMVCILVEGMCIYKLFQKYDALQEQRLKEWSDMVNDYNKLCNDINGTLDLLIKVSGKNNGTGTK